CAPVDLLFVLLVPQAATDAHLELLRQIASMLDRADVRERLRSAKSGEALYQVVLDVQNGH
ncbi:PTS transporter subunit EIIA, partial [Pseudomonas syringae pv. actinidiae]|nr:PTS transporter subunit EIIA [Pseudomonas syringae pv. actinidiae]